MNQATNLDLAPLRASGRWALYFELVHARGDQAAVLETLAEVANGDRAQALAGLRAAAEARESRIVEKMVADHDATAGEPVIVGDALTPFAELAVG